MRIELKIDAQYTEPQVLVLTAELTDEVKELLKRLGTHKPENMVGFEGDVATILDPADIVRVFSENQKIHVQTQTKQYLVRMRLYEVETLLDTHQFVRISNSEIVNLRKVENLDLSISGTICVRLKNGHTAYASRRYVPKIKQILGL